MIRRILTSAAFVTLALGLPAQAQDRSCAPQDWAALKGWNQVWAAVGPDAAAQGLSGRGGPSDFKILGLDAPWTDDGWARMAGILTRARSPATKQGGWGFPMMMNSYSELTFAVGLDQTTVINQYRDIRTIHTDGRGHMPEDQRWATNWGESTGCWEGDTLVVETVGVRFDPVFNILAPPLSEQARFVERIRLVSPGQLEDKMTITDPLYLTEPWTVTLQFVPAGLERLVLDAYDDRNDTEGGTITRSTREEFKPAQLPAGVELSEAQLDAVAGVYAIEGAPVELRFERDGTHIKFFPPGLGGGLRMFARDPLEFILIDGIPLRFTTDANGSVRGVEGTNPAGMPIKAARKGS